MTRALTGASLPVSMTHGGRGQLGDELVLVEALQAEGLDEIRLASGRHELRQRRADDRGRLEPVRAPAGADVEVLHLRLAEDRAVVRAEVAEPGPGPQDARVLELGEQLERVAREILEEVQGALHPVRRPRLDLRAHDELAAVGL